MPEALRILFPMEAPEVQAICRQHDSDYERGGSRLDRFADDCRFGMRLAEAGFAAAPHYFYGVRAGGESHYHKIGDTWDTPTPMPDEPRTEAP